MCTFSANVAFNKATNRQTDVKCCSQMDIKGTHNNEKDLVTNRKDPRTESTDFKTEHKSKHKMW